MLNKMAVKLSNRLRNNNVITEDVFDIYVYGFELIISSLISTVIVLLIGALLSKFYQTLVFLVVFILLRSFSGGYHADTYIKCSLVTFSTYAIVLLLSNFIFVTSIAYLILLVVGIIILSIFAPIKNPNKKLTFSKIKIFRIFSVLIFILFITVGIWLKEITAPISNVIFFTLMFDLFLLFVKNRNERRIRNESN